MSSQTHWTQVVNWFARLATHGIEIYPIVLVCVAADFRELLYTKRKFAHKNYYIKIESGIFADKVCLALR